MPAPFVYQALPARVVFGTGTLLRIADEVAALGCRRALVFSTPNQAGAARALVDRLGDRAVGMHAAAVMHTPVDVTEAALRVVKALDADCIVALGGGSTIGLSKAVALRTDLPQLVVPTTYAGSEATPILGETTDAGKTTRRDLKVLPEVILYDVELTLTIPPALSVTSGLNAMAHAVESLYAKDANPLISMVAEQGITAFARALPRIVANPQDLEARSEALYGAWACGTCLGAVGMALHHKLCHVLGGSFQLPHAETHAVLLPHAMAYNAPAVPEAMRRVAQALGCVDAVQGLHQLALQLSAPTRLADLGMKVWQVDQAVERACASPYWNPRPVEAEPLRRMLLNAFHGRPPNS